MPKNECPETLLFDVSDAAVKELIRSAKKRGYVTHGQINASLSSEEVKSEQIEDILAKLSEMGVNVVETKEAELEKDLATREETEEEAEGENELVEVQQRLVPAKSGGKEPAERTNDPVRMYLREMSSVELLSRESEIVIAKRIEAGRGAMIAGTLREPAHLPGHHRRDELNDGKVLLRDIIDLDATYAGPDAKAMPTPVISPDDQFIMGVAVSGQPGHPPHMQAPATAPATAISFKTADERADREVTAAHGTISESNPDDDDDMENWLSVGAIEAELKPKVIATFDSVAGTYKRLRRLQDKDIQFQLKRLSISPAQERKYKKLKNEIIGEVKSLRLNRARIDTLVEQLYDINKRLVGYEGYLMRLVESHGVSREDFLKNYLGSELDPLWLNRVSKLTAKGWKNFVARDKDRIKELRAQIHMLATETGLEIGEFRKIVHMVQKGERETRQAKKRWWRRICASSSRSPRIYQPRPAIPRPDPGRQHRADEGGRQVRVSARLQVLDLRDLVDQAGGQPLARRSVAYHPRPRTHDRHDRKRSATSRRMVTEIGREPTPEELAEKLGTPLDKVRKTLRIAREPLSLETPIGDEGELQPRRPESRTRTRSCQSTPRSSRTCARPRHACWLH